jgi:hypothetical protein
VLAILSTLALFLIWSAVGLAALAALKADVQELRVALTAPILGTALTTVPLFALSNVGVPMNVGAPPVCAVLIVVSFAALVFRRPRLSFAVVPVILLCVVDLLLVGHPMFRFGFDWIANANGDMAYYVLSATQFTRHGLQSAVDVHALAGNRDFATSAQQLTLRGLRPGAQVTLAGLAASTGRAPVTLYMPMSIAIAMGTVCATGSLAMQASRRWWSASIAAALLVASPMAGYGIVQQLLPQDWGLGLAAALFSWLMRPELHGKQRPRISDLVVISLLVVALFDVAFEVASSLIPAYGIYVAILAARRRASLRAVALLWSAPIVATIVFVNTYLPRAIHYLIHFVLNFGTSQGFRGLSLFGYAVVPTALPGAAGFRSLFSGPQAPHMSLYIVLAAGFFVGVLIASVVTASKGAAAGVVMLSMVLLGIMLARNGNDFGLFKLYMYGQPFLAATIAVFLSGMRSRPRSVIVAAAMAGVVALQLPTLNGYVRNSVNPIDLRNASQSDLLPKFARVVKSATAPMVTVTDNFALGQLEGASAGDKQVFFVGRNLFGLPWRERRLSVPSTHGITHIAFGENPAAARILSRGSCLIMLPTGSQLALNRRSLPEGSPNLARLPCRNTKNLLAFVVSSLGQPATLPDARRAVSFWQLEPDPSFPGHTFSGFGRYALFQVLGATSRVRVVLNFTTSSTNPPSGSYRLPPAAVVGSDRVRFPVSGSGSARVVSPTLKPWIVGGQPYVLLDMGMLGEFPLVLRPGVTGLWGKSVVLDPRLLTSYVRDVSLVSVAKYDRMRAPAAIRNIPADLANPNLEYSGIYEDGWVAQESYAQLSGGPAARLVIHAVVPPRRHGQKLRVLVNGLALASRSVRSGSLDLDLPLPASSGRRKIELRWAGVTPLTAPDRRSAAAHLTFLGVVAR